MDVCILVNITFFDSKNDFSIFPLCKIMTETGFRETEFPLDSPSRQTCSPFPSPVAPYILCLAFFMATSIKKILKIS